MTNGRHSPTYTILRSIIIPYSPCDTVRTERSASFCSHILPHLLPYVNTFFKIFSMFFYFLPLKDFLPLPENFLNNIPYVCERHLYDISIESRCKSNKKIDFFVVFFYSVSFLTKILTKNRTKWIFTNSTFQGIILRLSAAPTPQRHAQRIYTSAKYQAYDISTHDGTRLCFFYFLFAIQILIYRLLFF